MGKKILNVLYFTLEDFESIKDGHSINKDLLREFHRHGHNVYAISPTERRKGFSTRLIRDEDNEYRDRDKRNKSYESNKTDECNENVENEENAENIKSDENVDRGKKISVVILKPRIGNIQKTKNFIEKGISTVTIGWILKRAIKKYLSDVKFDLIIYCTPPITFLSAIEYVKKRDGARTYLLLKDIFPQNAVDLGMLSIKGLKGILYQYFRRQEKKLYAISDSIGCMSPANVEYVLKHNQEIKKDKVEVCPNCIDKNDDIDEKLFDEETRIEARTAIRKKYGLPVNKKIFIYGGNLGKPQGIPFLIKCLRACTDLDCYFLIVGDGTEKHLLVEYIEENDDIEGKQPKQPKQPKNLKLIEQLPQDKYRQLVTACDVGLIFLEHKFTIPNFPSRLLNYMAAKLPVLACTDKASDVGKIVVEGGFGWWCESNDINSFVAIIQNITSIDINNYGQAGYKYLKQNYTVEEAYRIIRYVQ